MLFRALRFACSWDSWGGRREPVFVSVFPVHLLFSLSAIQCLLGLFSNDLCSSVVPFFFSYMRLEDLCDWLLTQMRVWRNSIEIRMTGCNVCCLKDCHWFVCYMYLDYTGFSRTLFGGFHFIEIIRVNFPMKIIWDCIEWWSGEILLMFFLYTVFEYSLGADSIKWCILVVWNEATVFQIAEDDNMTICIYDFENLYHFCIVFVIMVMFSTYQLVPAKYCI